MNTGRYNYNCTDVSAMFAYEYQSWLHACAMKVHVKAGAQLIARFSSETDPLGVLALVREVVVGALGSEFAVRLEVARGSTAVYIAFVEDILSITGILEGLLQQGHRSTSFLTPTARLASWRLKQQVRSPAIFGQFLALTVAVY